MGKYFLRNVNKDEIVTDISQMKKRASGKIFANKTIPGTVEVHVRQH